MNVVIYARYSGDRQREASIEDQARVCRRYAEQNGLDVVRVYEDRAISGAVKARPGYLRLLDDAGRGVIDVLIVHDLSRLSRDDYELKGTLRKLLWQEMRVIGVADGYDSTRQGHKIHAGFKGLMNELHLDDIRAWTHKGMAGKAEAGYNCGGRTYGYRNIPIEDPSGKKDAYGRPAILAVRYEVDEAQASVVRKIYGWYGDGYSYKWIAAELNRQGISASRGGTWVISAVKVVLDNEMYRGTLAWNRRTWMKHPETGKRTYRHRPPSEWIVREMPELRIVSHEVMNRVTHRQDRNKKQAAGVTRVGSAQRYLFSGLMECAHCGGNMVIVTPGRYGCATHKTRGPTLCAANGTVSRRVVEDRLLYSIKSRLLENGSIEKFTRTATRLLESQIKGKANEEIKREHLAAERRRLNLVAAISQGILTTSTKEALEAAELEVARLAKQIGETREWNVPVLLPRLIERYRRAVTMLEQHVQHHVEPVRDILRSLLGERIRIHRRDGYFEAELSTSVQGFVAKCLNLRHDSGGCGGPHCDESTSVFVSLAPR